MDLPPRLADWLRRPTRPWLVPALGLVVCLAPAWLFGDLLGSYRLILDDPYFVAASRSWPRTLANLFEPHNAHVLPTWRLATWAIVALAGRLAALQGVLAAASFASLAATMLLVGRLAARETGRASIGLGAMIALGTTSVILPAATWFAASQTLWAAFGVLATLRYLQGWRRSGGAWRLVAAGLAAWIGGGIWSLGHAAGPVGAVYLWADGGPRCRRVAWIPLAASGLAVALVWTLFGTGDRTGQGSLNPFRGAIYTLQAIPEDLLLGNLGLSAPTTSGQGAVLTLALALAWIATWRAWGRPGPLESAGAALMLLGDLAELSARAYLPFSSLREATWYAIVPNVGFVLLVAGVWARSRGIAGRPSGPIARPTRGEALALVAFLAAWLALHRPPVEAGFQGMQSPLTPEEAKAFPTPDLRHLRAVFMADEHAAWQRRALERLDQAEAVARRQGIGLDAIRGAFGPVHLPVFLERFDAIDLLDLPAVSGIKHDPAKVREALGPWLAPEPDPAPAGSILKAIRAEASRPPG